MDPVGLKVGASVQRRWRRSVDLVPGNEFSANETVALVLPKQQETIAGQLHLGQRSTAIAELQRGLVRERWDGRPFAPGRRRKGGGHVSDGGLHGEPER